MAETGQGNTERGRIDVLEAVEALPPLPAVALRVMEVAQNPKSSASDLALVVSSDPGLSGRLLRVVNSAAYRRAREITSVQEALVTVGFVQARNMAISGAIAGAYAPDALNALFRIDTFWRHRSLWRSKRLSLRDGAGGWTCRAHSRRESCTTWGGWRCSNADPAGLDQAVAVAMQRETTLEQVEQELLGFDHAEIGGRLAAKWNLPAAIQAAIAHHHGDMEVETTLAGCVAAADRYVCANGLLPGYVVPPKAGEIRAMAQDYAHLAKQVDALMELVTGTPAGVAA